MLVTTGALLFGLGAAHADDDLVRAAKALTARDFDQTLPAEPVEQWVRAHVPASYEVVWGEIITDCGEGTGGPADRERDMPACAEVEIRDGQRMVGYLALFVATAKRGLMPDRAGLYYGHLEHQGRKYQFRRLSELRRVTGEADDSSTADPAR